MRVRSGSRTLDGEDLPLATAAYAQAVAAGRQHSLFNGPDRTFSFGPFRLIPARHLVLRDGVPLHLGSRALAILTALVERRGELVTRDELIATAWPNLFVHESNLKVNMANLRRSLGDAQKEPTYIATVIGRGYRFVAPVEIGATVDIDRNVDRVA